MAEFIALPVGQGDAFYLKRGNLRILVDGGKSELGFPGLFRAYTSENDVDIVICTHNDADHVNGIIGFLKQGLICKEIWLPGVWADVLPSALKSYPEKLRDVYESLEEEGYPTLDELIEQIEDEPPFEEHFSRDKIITVKSDENIKPWYEGFEDLLEAASDSTTTEDIYHSFRNYYHISYPGYYSSHLQPYIAATDRIKEIAILAYHAGITVRWFEYDAHNPSGGIPQLVPLNSRELVKIRKRKIEKLTHYIALSVANKRSLVFHSPADSDAPDVLFNADSDLSGVGAEILAANCIATAPHHGSASNRGVYAYVESWVLGNPGKVNWVRSDGAFPSRPCAAFVHTQGNRFCTLCNASPTTGIEPKQAVRLKSTPSSWIAEPNVRACACR